MHRILCKALKKCSAATVARHVALAIPDRILPTMGVGQITRAPAAAAVRSAVVAVGMANKWKRLALNI